MINLAKREGVMNSDSPELVSTAEAATLQLELRYLSWLTGNEEYWEKAEKVRCRAYAVEVELTDSRL